MFTSRKQIRHALEAYISQVERTGQSTNLEQQLFAALQGLVADLKDRIGDLPSGDSPSESAAVHPVADAARCTQAGYHLGGSRHVRAVCPTVTATIPSTGGVTLGELAEDMSDWRRVGVTRGAVEYVINQVWWEQ
jgi:hypothetical protein